MRSEAITDYLRARLFGANIVALLLATMLCPVVGCQTAPHAPDTTTVAAHLTRRIGQTIPCQVGPGEIVFPPGTSLDDGITEDEAVAIALYNNAAFQELLVDLNIARGDLIQAGLLPNPEFVYFWPMSEKPYKYLFDLPIEAIWLRPIRVKSAAREADRVADRLTQAGLDLMRDVRQAHADVVLAHERVRVAREGVSLRGRIAELAEKRFKAGDTSEQEAATGRIDSAQAQQDAARVGSDVPVLEERLRNLMGIGLIRAPLRLDALPPPQCQVLDADALTKEALASRPDALAAAEAVAAAQARVTFAKLGWVRLLGIADATSGKDSHVLGPAVRFTVPIFNWNQGNIARADAELERAIRNQTTVANQIILDVNRAYFQFRQSCNELEILRTKVQPEVEGAVKRAQAGYQAGNIAIFIVLENTRQRLDTDLREAQLHGDLRRFWAELERSVGRRLVSGPNAQNCVSDAATTSTTPTKISSPRFGLPTAAEVRNPVAATERTPQ